MEGVADAGELRLKAPSDLPHKPHSRTEAAMEQRLESLEPGSQRFQILRVAIDFKRSWLELAAQLSEIEGAGAYREWGFRTFDAYARHELHLRKDTAQKLLRSYRFLDTHEKPMLEGPDGEGQRVAAVPSYQALDVLAEARSNPDLSEKDYQDLRDQVFTEDPSAAQVRRLVRDRAPDVPKADEADTQQDLRKCLSLAERLYGLLCEQDDVPDSIPQTVEQVVGSLRKLLDDS